MTYKGPTSRLSPEARGYDKDWWRARARHLRAEPYCRMCAAQGIETKATRVDHVVSIRRRPDLRLEPSNFQSLCESHHNLLTEAFDSGDLRGACDVDGLPLDPDHPWLQEDPAVALANVNRPFRPSNEPAPEKTARLLKRQALGARR